MEQVHLHLTNMITLHESAALLLEGTLLAILTFIAANKKIKNSLLLIYRILLAVISSIIICLVFKFIYDESYGLILICNAIYVVIVLLTYIVLKPEGTVQTDKKTNYILSAIIIVVLLGNIGAKYLSGKNYLLSEHVNVIVITDLRTNQEYTINDSETINQMFDSVLEYNLNVHEIREIDGEPAIQITTYRYDDIYCNTIELYDKNENRCDQYKKSDKVNYYKVPESFVETIYDYIDSQQK